MYGAVHIELAVLVEVIQVQIIGALFHKFQVAAGEGGGHDGQLQPSLRGSQPNSAT